MEWRHVSFCILRSPFHWRELNKEDDTHKQNSVKQKLKKCRTFMSCPFLTNYCRSLFCLEMYIGYKLCAIQARICKRSEDVQCKRGTSSVRTRMCSTSEESRLYMRMFSMARYHQNEVFHQYQLVVQYEEAHHQVLDTFECINILSIIN